MERINFGEGLLPDHLMRLSNWLKGELFGATPNVFMMAPAAKEEFPAGLQRDQIVRVAFITLSDGLGRYVVGHAMNTGLEKTLREALKMAKEKANFKVQRAKFDLVAEAISIKKDNLRYNKTVVHEPSLLGVALDSWDQIWLPEENLRYRLVRKDLGIDYDVLAEHLLERVPAASDYNVSRPKKGWLFSTAAYLITGSEVAPLIRGHRERIAFSESVARERALAGAHYLARSVRDDGSYVYMYQSGPNREPDDYNMVRHAGTTWSLLDILPSETRSEQAAFLTESIHRAAGYLRKHIEPDPWRAEGSSALIMNEFGTAKLGGNGLSMVALVDYYRLAPSDELLTEIRGLAQWILDSQADDGQFTVHKLDLDSGEASSFLSDYYPGEAILGLMRLYGIDPDPRWKEAAAQGARWLINVRDAGKGLLELEHDHWLLYGLNEVYREFPEPLFLAHTRKLVDAILEAQHGGARSTLPEEPQKVPDWNGGWYSPPRTTPAACRVEGLMAAATLLRDHGEPAEVEAILEAAEAGLKFQLQNQIWHEKEMYLADPARAHGGFHSNLNNWHIRIDYVQHSISALIAYARWD